MRGNLQNHRLGDGWTWRPPRERWLSYLWLGLLLDLLFVIVYGGSNLIAHSRSEHLALYLAWETAIPLVPAFIYPYFSILLLFLLPPFALGPVALRRLAIRLGLATLGAGMVFLLFPARLGFEPAHAGLPPLMALLHQIDLPYNLVPSLHVTYSGLLMFALGAGCPLWPRVFFGIWLAVMCVSVVLLHQHHLLDVISGLALAVLVQHLVDRR